MQLLNNFDIIILTIIGISSFLAFSRGFIRELMSIIGWILITVTTLFLIPIVNGLVSRYVDNVAFVSVIVLIVILFLMFFFWLFFTKRVIDTVRDSKMSYFDRFFGFLFGFCRGILLIVLFSLLVNWIAPKNQQAEAFKDSVYFQMAEKMSEPLEKLIPESTLKNIHKKSSIEGLIDEIEENNDELLDKMAQPKVVKTQEKIVDDLENITDDFLDSI